MSHHLRRCISGKAAHLALTRIPLKKNGPLPDREQVEGYGIYAVDGWSVSNSLRVLTLILAPFFAFAAYWLVRVDSKDIQSAMALPMFALALIALIFVFREHAGAI